MARTVRSFDSAKVRRGLILIGLCAALALAVFFLDVAIRATAEGQRITVFAEAAPELRPGSPVWVAGRPVGRVLSVSFREPGAEGGPLQIRAVLERGVEDQISRNATAEIRASELLAPVVVAIDPGDPASGPWDPSTPLETRADPLDREALLALADSLLDAGRRLAEQTERTRAVFDRRSGSLQRLRSDPDPLLGLRDDLERLREVLVRDFPESTLARLASDTIVGPAAARLQGRLDALARSPGRAGAEAAATAMSEALDALERRVAELSRGLEAGEGTLGRALVDGELSRRFAELRSTLRDLTAYLMRDPSPWLRVRIF